MSSHALSSCFNNILIIKKTTFETNLNIKQTEDKEIEIFMSVSMGSNRTRDVDNGASTAATTFVSRLIAA